MLATATYNGEPVIIIDDTLLVKFQEVMIKTDNAKTEWVKYKNLKNVVWLPENNI